MRKRPNLPPTARTTGAITAEKFGRLEWDPALRERRTTADYVATALRTAIYDGQFADGEELNQVELAAYFKVSRVPIREALRQLQAEELVRNIAHHRAVVAGLTCSEMLDLMEMRAVLEAYMLEKSAPQIDQRTKKQLRDLCSSMDPIRDYGKAWVVKNWEFHHLLYKAGNSPLMIETVERIHLKVERYVRQTGSPERARAAAQEHQSILTSIERKDYASASAQLRHHILSTGEQIQRFWESKERGTVIPRGKTKLASRLRGSEIFPGSK
jgi:DNA-binding GntR family transcriptional regulator